MKSLFDSVSKECSKLVTKQYSTSFSLGILFLHPRLRMPVYAIYGFVRLADEIVDSFHGYDKKTLLSSFRDETYAAIENKISLNPVLNSFQETVHKYNIKTQWIEKFFDSMEMDLQKEEYDYGKYEKYIFGSAEVVGLMCLHVFTEGNEKMFEALKPSAMKLGAAFQKVNFLRDLKADSEILGRNYFPDIDLKNFSYDDKYKIEKEIEKDFEEALNGIKRLPESSRNGVYLAYQYYTILFRKIKSLPPGKIMNERIRIPNYRKFMLMISCNIRYQFNML